MGKIIKIIFKKSVDWSHLDHGVAPWRCSHGGAHVALVSWVVTPYELVSLERKPTFRSDDILSPSLRYNPEIQHRNLVEKS